MRPTMAASKTKQQQQPQANKPSPPPALARKPPAAPGKEAPLRDPTPLTNADGGSSSSSR